MKINEVAKRTGVTVRTLHYYDRIGLLKPRKITGSGYRLYDDTSLARLQQILFFKELDFSLEEIRAILDDPRLDPNEVLAKQKDLLLQKRAYLDGLIDLVEKTMKGTNLMNFQAFDKSGIEETRKKYAQEVKERWGSTEAYKAYEKKSADYSSKQWELFAGEGAEILGAFGESRHLSPEDPQAQALVRRWQDYISDRFYPCTKEILSCLGCMYLEDQRFTQNIDQYGAGTAAFMAAAIAHYCR